MVQGPRDMDSSADMEIQVVSINRGPHIKIKVKGLGPHI